MTRKKIDVELWWIDMYLTLLTEFESLKSDLAACDSSRQYWIDQYLEANRDRQFWKDRTEYAEGLYLELFNRSFTERMREQVRGSTVKYIAGTAVEYNPVRMIWWWVRHPVFMWRNW